MAQLGRAATDQDILVSEHGRRFGIFGDGGSGNPSGLILDNKVIFSNRVVGSMLIKPATSGGGAGAITLTGAIVGDRVIAVMDTHAALQVDVTTSFESAISVAGQIQQLATPSTSSHEILVYLSAGS